MAGGFLSGLVVGAVVSGVALGAVSVAVGPTVGQGPETAALDVPAGSGFNQARDDTAARLPQAGGAPDIAGDAPRVGTAAPDNLSQMEDGDTQPGAQPRTGAVQADLSAPQSGGEDSGMPQALARDPTEEQSGQQATDNVTVADPAASDPAADDTSISADPAQPSQPEIDADAGYSIGIPASDPIDDTPGEVTAPDTLAPDNAAGEDTAHENVTESGDPASDSAERDADDAPSGIIGDIAPDIERSRLPSVGTAPADAQAEAPATDLPAIEAFAAPFDNPDGKPLMSIVLIDDGSSPIGLDALASFPYPLSFAVDAAWPGAADAMRRYRDAGFEVLAITDLPAGATARDTETTLQAVQAAVPQAVAIMEGTGEGLQISREASEQLASILLESGQGLVLFSNGLETASKLIGREGVPVSTVFRDFDAKDQSATVIRRFLDQAAFKAGRDEDGVVMLGRLRADTISALLLWGLQDRASRVALAPISAVLTTED